MAAAGAAGEEGKEPPRWDVPSKWFLASHASMATCKTRISHSNPRPCGFGATGGTGGGVGEVDEVNSSVMATRLEQVACQVLEETGKTAEALGNTVLPGLCCEGGKVCPKGAVRQNAHGGSVTKRAVLGGRKRTGRRGRTDRTWLGRWFFWGGRSAGRRCGADGFHRSRQGVFIGFLASAGSHGRFFPRGVSHMMFAHAKRDGTGELDGEKGGV